MVFAISGLKNGVPLADRLDRAHQVHLRRVLEQVSLGAGIQCRKQVVLIGVHAQNDHAHSGFRFTIWAVASIPFSSGIAISMMTMSGSVVSARRTASRRPPPRRRSPFPAAVPAESAALSAPRRGHRPAELEYSFEATSFAMRDLGRKHRALRSLCEATVKSPPRSITRSCMPISPSPRPRTRADRNRRHRP